MQYQKAAYGAAGNGHQRDNSMSQDNTTAPGSKRRGLMFHLRRQFIYYGRSFLNIVRNPVAIQGWLVALFILAAVSTVIIDGISLSTNVSSLLQRDVIAP